MNNLKRYKEITGKEFIGNDYSIEKFQDSKAVSNLIKEIEKLEHYKHLYSEVKKQKDDGIDWIKNNFCYVGKKMKLKPFSDLKDLLRMLGEKNE